MFFLDIDPGSFVLLWGRCRVAAFLVLEIDSECFELRGRSRSESLRF